MEYKNIWIGVFWAGLAFFIMSSVSYLVGYWYVEILLSQPLTQEPLLMLAFSLTSFLLFMVLIGVPFTVSEIVFDLWYSKYYRVELGERRYVEKCTCGLYKNCSSSLIHRKRGGYRKESSGYLLCNKARKNAGMQLLTKEDK